MFARTAPSPRSKQSPPIQAVSLKRSDPLATSTRTQLKSFMARSQERLELFITYPFRGRIRPTT
ncbi:hypothetical protein BDV09DRAFT_149274 [Aspergillus tetrazonus]